MKHQNPLNIIYSFAFILFIALSSCNNSNKTTEETTKEPGVTENTSTSTPGKNEGNNTSSNLAKEPSTLNLRILDAARGYAVIPQTISIRKREDQTVNRKLDKENFAENGTITVGLPNGTYDITVTADDYKPLSSFFQLNNQALNMNFNLDPVSPPLELSDDYVQRSHRSDALLVLGYIVDSETGKPLETVKVSSKDNAATVSSMKTGYFQLHLPLPDNAQQIDNRNYIVFKKDGYITEARKNFDMWPNGDLILQIRLKKGTGIHEEDVLLKRKASVSLR